VIVVSSVIISKLTLLYPKLLMKEKSQFEQNVEKIRVSSTMVIAGKASWNSVTQ